MFRPAPSPALFTHTTSYHSLPFSSSILCWIPPFPPDLLPQAQVISSASVLHQYNSLLFGPLISITTPFQVQSHFSRCLQTGQGFQGLQYGIHTISGHSLISYRFLSQAPQITHQHSPYDALHLMSHSPLSFSHSLLPFLHIIQDILSA